MSVLSISPSAADHELLEGSLPRHWIVHRAFNSQEGTALLRRRSRLPIAVCERDLQPRAWKDLMAEFATLPDAPLLIVTSRCPDERLWAEALNLGAHDVLAKPFDASELARTLHSALNQWKNRRGRQAAENSRRSSAGDFAA